MSVTAIVPALNADDRRHIPDLLAPLLHGQADLVLGSRLAGKIEPGAMPYHQRLGNQFAAWLIRRLYRLELTDLSPFRAVGRRSLLALKMEDSRSITSHPVSRSRRMAATCHHQNKHSAPPGSWDSITRGCQTGKRMV